MRFLLSLIICGLFALPANATIAFSVGSPGHHRGPKHMAHQGYHGVHYSPRSYCNPYQPYRPRQRTIYVQPSRYYPRPATIRRSPSSWITFPYVEPVIIINPFFEGK